MEHWNDGKQNHPVIWQNTQKANKIYIRYTLHLQYESSCRLIEYLLQQGAPTVRIINQSDTPIIALSHR